MSESTEDADERPTSDGLFETGGLERLRPSKEPFFWPVSATYVAETGQTWGSRGPDGPREPTFQIGSEVAEEAECPLCGGTMRLWAGFYRCQNCGYKESCCF